MPDPKKEPEFSPGNQDWRALAEQASNEPDPGKFIQLVQDLCDRLDQRVAQLTQGHVKTNIDRDLSPPQPNLPDVPRP